MTYILRCCYYGLSVLFAAFLLTGCYSSSQLTDNGERSIAVLYKSPEELKSMTYHEMGMVSGEDCQMTLQDPPANFGTARIDMQSRAAKMGANGVLLDNCEMINGNSGCSRQAVCRGNALNISM